MNAKILRTILVYLVVTARYNWIWCIYIYILVCLKDGYTTSINVFKHIYVVIQNEYLYKLLIKNKMEWKQPSWRLQTNLNIQLTDNFFQVICLYFSCHDFHHFLPNLADLLMLGIGSLANLVVSLLGEANAEKAKKIPISSFDINMGFNHCLENKSYNSLSLFIGIKLIL